MWGRTDLTGPPLSHQLFSSSALRLFSSAMRAPMPDDTPVVDTLDEPIRKTLWRDVKRVLFKLSHVLIPRGQRVSVLRDWDLWGPLALCLFLACLLSIKAPTDQASLVFAAVFVISWVGAAVVTINAVVLGANLSFLQSVCVLGYCVFPLSLAALICQLYRNIIFRSIVVLSGGCWCTLATVDFLSPVSPAHRKALVLFPVMLYYAVLGWMVLVS